RHGRRFRPQRPKGRYCSSGLLALLHDDAERQRNQPAEKGSGQSNDRQLVAEGLADVCDREDPEGSHYRLDDGYKHRTNGAGDNADEDVYTLEKHHIFRSSFTQRYHFNACSLKQSSGARTNSSHWLARSPGNSRLATSSRSPDPWGPVRRPSFAASSWSSWA